MNGVVSDMFGWNLDILLPVREFKPKFPQRQYLDHQVDVVLGLVDRTLDSGVDLVVGLKAEDCLFEGGGIYKFGREFVEDVLGEVLVVAAVGFLGMVGP